MTIHVDNFLCAGYNDFTFMLIIYRKQILTSTGEKTQCYL